MAAPSPVAAAAPTAASSSNTSRTTVDALGSESLGGFAPGSGTEVRVSGSRTVGLFVLPNAGTRIDNAAIRASLLDSASREGRDFARVTGIQVQDRPPAVAGAVRPLSAVDARRFADMELTGARLLEPGISSEHWLVVEASVASYTPGTTVYLVVSSTTLVIGSATVGADGTARITGAVPLDLLGGGAHRLRIVGSREFGTVIADKDGGLQVPERTLAEIRLFDEETTAVVEVLGLQADGGTRQLIRLIPLRQEPPYWMLLIVADVVLLALYLRRRRLLGTLRSALLMSIPVVITAAAVAYVIWTLRYPELAGVALVIGAVGLLVVLPRRLVTRSIPRRGTRPL